MFEPRSHSAVVYRPSRAPIARWLLATLALGSLLLGAHWSTRQRHDVRADPQDPPAPALDATATSKVAATDPHPNFDQLLLQLTHRLRSGQPETAVLDRITAVIEHPARSALQNLGEVMAEDRTEGARTRRAACIAVLRRALQDTHREQEQGRGRALRRLVDEILHEVPSDEVVADQLVPLLTSGPYLTIEHEAHVLKLARTARDAPHLVRHATELLARLWHNLEATHARDRRTAVHLALWYRQSSNPVERRAAWRHLLVTGGGRHRERVLDEILDRRDRGLASDLAQTAIAQLSSAQAIQVLVRLRRLWSATERATLASALRQRRALRTHERRQLQRLLAPDEDAEPQGGGAR